MSEDRHGAWTERLARRLGIATPFEQPAGFVFVLSASGALASLAGAVLATFLGGRTDWATILVLLPQAAIFVAALVLLREGRTLAAAWTLFLTSVVATTLLVLTGNPSGYDDIAIMLYPVVVIGASVLFDSRNFAVAQALVALGLVAILAQDLAGGSTRPGSVVADFGFALLIVLVTGAGSRFLAASLRASNAERRRQEEALTRVNLELESRAAERERLIRELEMRNSELERFAYTISHELKSPLVTIGGFLPLFKRSAEAGDGDSARRHYRRVEEAHGRMHRLLSELLELCRLGFLHQPAEDVALAEVVAEARAAAEATLSANKVRVEVAADLPMVRGDRPRLVEVFQNLIENAARFSAGHPRPTVEIAVRCDDGEIAVLVRDNGIGIEPSHHEAVFELFHKLDSGDQGTGVGLAIVHRIVELHGGRIWVESDGKGAGTTVCMVLPWVEERRVGGLSA